MQGNRVFSLTFEREIIVYAYQSIVSHLFTHKVVVYSDSILHSHIR